MKVELNFFIISFFYCCDCLNSPEKIRILARNNYKLVPYFSKQYIRKYNLKNHHKEELIQYGYEGFMKACEKFDDTRGFKLSTYSRFWIHKYMDDYIKDKMKTDLIIPLNVLKYNNILDNEKNKNVFNDYTLKDWEKILLYRKYYKKETFIKISQSLNISRETLRKKYNNIYEKIRTQYNFENSNNDIS